jgi:hypothetical protein
MATRSNRAATASSKQGGRSRTRNRTARSFSNRRPLDSAREQRVFRENRRESLARRRNATTNVRTRKDALGVDVARDSLTELLARGRGVRVPRVGEPPGRQPRRTGKRRAAPSGRGISGGEIHERGRPARRAKAGGK